MSSLWAVSRTALAANHSPRALPSLRVTCSAQTAPDNALKSSEKRANPMQWERRAVLSSVLLAPLLLNTDLAEASIIKKGMTVFVAGATGNTGQRIVRQLSQQGFTVLAATRDNKKAEKLFGNDSSIQLVNYDLFDSESIAKAMRGADAVVSALGYSGFNLGGYKQVDLTGNGNLIEAAQKAGILKFVLLTSLLTNGRAVGQENNGNFKFLNLFGGVLDNKLEAEKLLRGSRLDWTIVRPGGLSNDTPEQIGNVYFSKEDTLFGLDGDPGREISRDSVAAVMVEALQQDAAKNKVVEIVAGKNLPTVSKAKWFDL